MIDWLATHGSLMVLLFFFCLFLAFSIWAFMPTNKKKMQDYGQIPLRETNNGE